MDIIDRLDAQAGTVHSAAFEVMRDAKNEIKRLRYQGSWRPIESAPIDGTPIDLFRKGQRLTNMRYVDLGAGNTFFEAIKDGYSCVRDATHWMPIPLKPIISNMKEPTKC